MGVPVAGLRGRRSCDFRPMLHRDVPVGRRPRSPIVVSVRLSMGAPVSMAACACVRVTPFPWRRPHTVFLFPVPFEVAAARFEPVGLDVGFDQFVPMVPHPSFGLFFVQSLRHMDRESPPPMIGYSKPANSENSILYRTVPDRPRPSGSDRSEFHTIKSANVLPRVSVSFPGLSWSMRMPSTVQPSGMRVGS